MSKVAVTFGAQDVNLGATLNKINSDLGRMRESTKKVEAQTKMSFAGMAKAGAALAVGIGAVKGAFRMVQGTFDNFKEALDMGGELSDLSARTGETAGNLAVLRRAFENTGAGADKVGPALNKLQRSIVEAGTGNKTAAAAFDRLGLKFDELKYKAPIDQVKAVAAALAALPNDSDRAATAMQIFGRSGGELLPMFMSMSEEIATAKGELGSLPDVMDKNASAFDSISDKLTVVKGKMTEFSAGMLQSLLPALNKIIGAGSELDAAGFGQHIGQRLSEAFEMISSGDVWELFRMHGEKAIMAIQASPAMNSFAALLNTIFDGITAKSGEFDFDTTFEKYKNAGIEANVELADEIDAKLKDIWDKQAERSAEAMRRMKEEMAEIAANSGIMLKDIREAAKETTEIPKWLQRVPKEKKTPKEKDPSGSEEMFAKNHFLTLFGSATSNAARLMQSIVEARAKDRIDPGGRQENRAQRYMEKGQFGAAERAGKRLAKREEDMEIQEYFNADKDGNAQKFGKSVKDLAKEQGIDTFGKTSRELREELLEKARAWKREGKDGEKGAGKDGKKGGGKDDKPADNPLVALVTEIKGLMVKLEQKLPTPALRA